MSSLVTESPATSLNTTPSQFASSTLPSSVSSQVNRPKQLGRGRPAIARGIWQQSVMQRRLVRLYLYTCESSLNTKQISTLLTELAKLEGGENWISKARLKRSTRAKPQQSASVCHRSTDASEISKSARSTLDHNDIPEPNLQNNSDQETRSISDTDSLGERDSVRERIRKTWLRGVLGPTSSAISMSSSVYSEIRSLLSRYSSRSSLLSWKSSIPDNDQILTLPPDLASGATTRNATLIELCCSIRHDCLHRQVSTFLSSGNVLSTLGEVALCRRDIWNETVLHLVARWAPCESFLSILDDLVIQMSSKSLNSRNIDGNTFLHIVADRWHCHDNSNSTPTELETTQLAGLMFRAGESGYNFQALPIGRSVEDTEARIAKFVKSCFGIDKVAGTVFPTSLPQPRVGPLHSEANILHAMLNWVPKPSVQTFSRFLNDGADPNDYNKDGQTLVMAVIENMAKRRLSEQEGSILINMLVAVGADLEQRDYQGNTALGYAVRRRFSGAVQQLIQLGIWVYAKNRNGETALQLAVQQYEGIRAKVKGGLGYGRSQTILVKLFDSVAQRT
ncbi:hypothetical protein QBC35DRAFT_549478 [Podospora australis]|uniref:Ankyrin repeat protein n=1 Tax=Podospora australis TaxID=1536484 RepID=A0AAN7ADS7_9PEZI|nr:hypothetical protein QBC35DRAFT_549478 [Podospora australis]